LGFGTAFLLMASTMALNDVYDRDVDAINSPGRPIPSGQVSVVAALVLALALAALGLVVAAMINAESFAIAVFATALMSYYNTVGKGTGFFGNVVVSICVSLPFVFGAFAVRQFHPNLVIFTALAFLANLGREIIKGIADVKGDLTRNVRTLAVMYGSRKAALWASIFIILSVGASLTPLVLGTVSILYAIPLALSCAGFLITVSLILKDHSEKSALEAKNQLLLWMFFGLVAFLVGSAKLL